VAGTIVAPAGPQTSCEAMRQAPHRPIGEPEHGVSSSGALGGARYAEPGDAPSRPERTSQAGSVTRPSGRLVRARCAGLGHHVLDKFASLFA
jgi:hypothetical protein